MRERRLAQLRRNLARYGFRLRVSPAWCAHGKFDIWDLRDNTFVFFDLALEDAEKWLAKWEAGSDARTRAAYRKILKKQERANSRASRSARPRSGRPRLRLVTS